MNPPKKNTPDYLLLFLTMILTAFGLLMVYSASSTISVYDNKGDSLKFIISQGIAVGLGLVLMLILMNFHYSWLRKIVFLFWIGNLAMLVLVLFIGNGKNVKGVGANSWIDLGPMNIQPSEFAKLAVILYLAVVITNKGEKLKKIKNGLLPCLIIIGITAGLILLQPDFGSAAILILGSFAILWTGGMRTKHLLAIGACGAGLIFLKIFVPSIINSSGVNYQLDRFHTWLDPWFDPDGSGYQMINSLYAFGHGGLTGTGIGNSIQKLHFLTQPY
ncbi:MAG: FtsW/RodA/SpoVE family cell cycle protein, partial [Gorillibacterium sp.]|nr:FtsW/RodA/SpoVE family cell cycle protein [Gorillibacterium sp.]